MANEKILRVTRTKEQAKKTYNKISRIYDIIEGSFEKKFRNPKTILRILDQRIRRFLRNNYPEIHAYFHQLKRLYLKTFVWKETG